jgi:hypothetical protein
MQLHSYDPSFQDVAPSPQPQACETGGNVIPSESVVSFRMARGPKIALGWMPVVRGPQISPSPTTRNIECFQIVSASLHLCFGRSSMKLGMEGANVHQQGRLRHVAATGNLLAAQLMLVIAREADIENLALHAPITMDLEQRLWLTVPGFESLPLARLLRLTEPSGRAPGAKIRRVEAHEQKENRNKRFGEKVAQGRSCSHGRNSPELFASSRRKLHHDFHRGLREAGSA